MSLSINSNSLSLNAQRSLSLHVASPASLITRLTAGTRINKASVDAAGQAMRAIGGDSAMVAAHTRINGEAIFPRPSSPCSAAQ